MSYSATYDVEAGLIKISMWGRVDQPMIKNLASEVARIAKEHNCFLILNDAREASLRLSTMGIYDLPKILLEILSESGIDIHRFKRALIISNDLDDMIFYETVSRNRGQDVMLFRDVDEARKWLSEK